MFNLPPNVSTAPKTAAAAFTAPTPTEPAAIEQVRLAQERVLKSAPLQMMQVNIVGAAILQPGPDGSAAKTLEVRLLGESGWAGSRELHVQCRESGQVEGHESVERYRPLIGIQQQPMVKPVEVRHIKHDHVDPTASHYEATWMSGGERVTHNVPGGRDGFFRAALSSFREMPPDDVGEEHIKKLRTYVAKHLAMNWERYAPAVAECVDTVPIRIAVGPEVKAQVGTQDEFKKIQGPPAEAWHAHSAAEQRQIDAENTRRLNALLKLGISLQTACGWVADPRIDGHCIDRLLSSNKTLIAAPSDVERKIQENLLKCRLLIASHTRREEKQSAVTKLVEAFRRAEAEVSSGAAATSSGDDPFHRLLPLMTAMPPRFAATEQPAQSTSSSGASAAAFEVPNPQVIRRAPGIMPAARSAALATEQPSTLLEAGHAVQAAIERRFLQLAHFRSNPLPEKLLILQQLDNAEASLRHFAERVSEICGQPDLAQVGASLERAVEEAVKGLEQAATMPGGPNTLPSTRPEAHGAAASSESKSGPESESKRQKR